MDLAPASGLPSLAQELPVDYLVPPYGPDSRVRASEPCARASGRYTTVRVAAGKSVTIAIAMWLLWGSRRQNSVRYSTNQGLIFMWRLGAAVLGLAALGYPAMVSLLKYATWPKRQHNTLWRSVSKIERRILRDCGEVPMSRVVI